MKLAFTFLTYGKNVFGGIENALHNLLKGLTQAGHDISVFTSPVYADSIDKRSKVRVCVSRNLPQSFDGDVAALIENLKLNSSRVNRDFENFLSKCNPRVVLVVDPVWGIIPLTGYVEKLNIPCALFHHVANEWPETQPWLAASFELPYNQHFSVSKFLVEEIKRSCKTAEKVRFTVIPNSIETSLYSGFNQVPKENYIFCNSRIAKRKNVDILVKAYAKICDRFDIGLKVCSGRSPFVKAGGAVEELKELVKYLKIENRVVFLPLLEWGEVLQQIAKAKVVVLPSEYETFGIAALEASVAGVPLIVSNATNFKHLVKDSAIFVNPGDVSGLAKKMDAVLENYEDYRSKAVKSRVKYLKYDNERVARRFAHEIRSYNL